MDYKVTTIQKILPHPNADRLEVAVVDGWKCIVGKGLLNEGDEIIYIAPDAQIVDPTQEWCKDFANYLGSGGRVRTAKLRGVFSEGIIISNPHTIEMLRDSGETFITHYEPPSKAHIAGNARAWNLPYHLQKTDQKNVQELNPFDYLGKAYYVTRKMDGSSCTITYEPESGEVHICSRTVDLKLDESNADNVFIKAAKPIVEALKSGKFLEKTGLYVLRGEVCGAGINKSKPNKDCHGEPTFHLFECRYYKDATKGEYVFENYFEDWVLADILHIKTVPVLGFVEQLTEEEVQRYLDAPASDGEGVVLWEWDDSRSCITGNSFKIKSKAYDAML